MLDIFALVVLFVLAAAAIWLVVIIGNIPGNIARAAEHPYAQAINVLAWVGLLTLGMGWLVALVWAYAKPPQAGEAADVRIASLEARLSELEGQS